MWVHFNFLCKVDTQIKLHKIFRSKISKWQGSLIDGYVLTYHFEFPRAPSDSLYVCLNIRSMSPPANRSLFLSQEQIAQLPREVQDTVTELSSQHLLNPELDKLQIRNYEFDIDKPETLSLYSASVEGILNFASKGSEIALELLDDNRTKQQNWRNDKELVTAINQLVYERLTTENERNWGLHFACNSMCFTTVIEGYLRGILSQSLNGEGYWALGYLDEIEKGDNIREALKRFAPVLPSLRKQR
jgi:hypothetical protein